MVDVYSTLYFVIGAIVTHACLLVWAALLLGGPVERARRHLERQPASCLVSGLLACLALAAVAGLFLLIREPMVRVVSSALDFLSAHLHFTQNYNEAWIVTNCAGWLLATPVMAGMIVGGAGFAQLFAARAREMMREDRPLVGLAVGAICTSAAYFTPFVGWFVFLPLVGLMSIGAGVRGLFGRREAPPPRSKCRRDCRGICCDPRLNEMARLSRRQFGQWTALAAGAIALGGCAPWEQADPEHELDRLVADPTPTLAEWRVLNRLGFGPRPGDVARLRAMGIAAWIDEQLHPEAIGENPELLTALAKLETLDLPADEARDRETEREPDHMIAPLLQKTLKVGKVRRPQPGPVRQELAQAAILRAAFSARRLQEVMADFWTDHFNVDQAKADCRWLKTADDRLLRQHALGRFRDLLGASAHSPAMLVYLDNATNRKADLAGSQPNENYARELLELHTLGDTSAYTLHDIQEVARALTGWTIGEAGTAVDGQFQFRAADHDEGPKTVLRETFPAGQDERDGERLLDRLAAHPLTARFIAGKLCYRFLGTVPDALRDRLAETFLKTDGDVRQILAELLRSDEFLRGKEPQFKRPLHFAISALRMLGVRTSGAALVPYLEAMGQRPFSNPSPDGYPMRPEPWAAGLLARWKFAIDLAGNRIDQTWINMAALERATRGQPAADVCRRLSERLLVEPLSGDDLAATATLGDASADPLAQQLAILLISPQFQWC